MTDLMSMQSSLLTDDQLIQKRKREKTALILGLLAQFVWASNSIQLKSYKVLFPAAFSLNSLLFWRSAPISILGFIIASKKGIEIPKISSIHHIYWFFIRSFGNYFTVIISVKLFDFFRVSTCQCIAGCQPVLILFLSILILHEKYYHRYLMGILVCILGTVIIVMNENTFPIPEDSNVIKDVKVKGNIFVGIFLAMLNLVINSFSTLGQKILCKDHMSPEVQNYYVGMFNALPAIIMCFFEMHLGLNSIIYIIYAISNAFMFYAGNYCNTLALNDMPLSKFIPITYMLTVFTFILGFAILREPVYFTDVFGSLLILSFQLYNVWVPLKKKK